jgi:sugar lactone lactonase YvrE
VLTGSPGSGLGLEQLNDPQGLFTTADGTTYVADYNNHRVLKFAAGALEGEVVAGGYKAGNELHELNYPTDVFVDADGDLYVADQSNNRIMQWVAGATIGTVVAGNGVDNGINWLSNPNGVAVANGKIYVADRNHNRVVKFSPSAEVMTPELVAGSSTGSACSPGHDDHCPSGMYNPTGVRFTPNGDILVAEVHNHRVMRWSPGATEGIRVAGSGHAGTSLDRLYYPYGIALDGDNVLVAEYHGHRVSSWAPGATECTVVAGGSHGSNTRQLRYPHDVEVGADSTVYVADYHNHRVMKWPAGATEGTAVAGYRAGAAEYSCCSSGYTEELLYHPEAVTVDDAGAVFVADRYHRVVKWLDGATAGTIVAGLNTHAGSGLDRLYNPRGLRIAGGELYIADYHNHRIVAWSFFFEEGMRTQVLPRPRPGRACVCKIRVLNQ